LIFPRIGAANTDIIQHGPTSLGSKVLGRVSLVAIEIIIDKFEMMICSTFGLPKHIRENAKLSSLPKQVNQTGYDHIMFSSAISTAGELPSLETYTRVRAVGRILVSLSAF
jgi:hypothetical protein